MGALSPCCCDDFSAKKNMADMIAGARWVPYGDKGKIAQAAGQLVSARSANRAQG